MKVNLEEMLKTLGLPLGLVAVFAAVLLMFGVQLDTALIVAGSMLGAQALIGLLVDVLKWAGVVNDGTAGKWSAGFNLVGLVVIAVVLSRYPAFDFAQVDAQLIDIAKFLALLLGYIIQVSGSKNVHQFMVNGLGVRTFSNSG